MEAGGCLPISLVTINSQLLTTDPFWQLFTISLLQQSWQRACLSCLSNIREEDQMIRWSNGQMIRCEGWKNTQTMVENQAAILIINYKYDTCLIVSPMSHVEEIKVSEEPKRAKVIFWWKPLCTPLETSHFRLETPWKHHTLRFHDHFAIIALQWTWN